LKLTVAQRIKHARSTFTAHQLDTYQLVTQLQNAGLSASQSVALKEAVLTTTREAHDVKVKVLATNDEFQVLKDDTARRLNEASLKFEIQQAQLRDNILREVAKLRNELSLLSQSTATEFAALKSDLKITQGMEYSKLAQQAITLEKLVEARKLALQSDIKDMENRLMKYFLTFAGTAAAFTLGVLRIHS